MKTIRRNTSILINVNHYLHDADGDRVNVCKNTNNSADDAVWSPDSRSFIYGHGWRTRYNYIVDVDDCWSRPFGDQTFNSVTMFSDWSSDGQRLLGETDLTDYNEPKETRVDYVRASFWTIEGDSLYSFGKFGETYEWPIWSSAEDYIAVGIRNGDGQRLYKLSSAGTERLQLTGDEIISIFPIAWSANDTRILASASYKKSWPLRSIVMVDATGRGATDITPFPGSDYWPKSWSTGKSQGTD